MKTLMTYSKKFFSQKGQGLVEYALLFGFVGAVALLIMINGGFRNSVENVFGTASDTLASANQDSDGAEGEEQPGEDSSSQNFNPLNWQRDIMPYADMTYNTISRNGTIDDALSSEIGFFNTLFTAVDGHLASTNAEDGSKDWESFLSMVENTKAKNNVATSYVRDEQKITIKRVGTKDLRITYADKENSYYYKLSPDANNVMQIETNSNKSYSQFFSSVMKNADGGGWQYSK